MKTTWILAAALICRLAAAGEVWFVPGWRTGFSSRAGCVRILRDAYPGREVKVKSWDSRCVWPRALRNAEAYTDELFREIAALPESERRELVLVGHSIGGKIVLEVLSRLAVRGDRIDSAALLGAVVPCDSPRVAAAMRAVRFELLNVCNPGDWVLKYLYPLGNDPAAPLGYSGWISRDPRFHEAEADHHWSSFFNHFAYRYLEALAKMLDRLPPRIEVRQDAPHTPRPPADTLFWSDVEEFGAWRLQRHYDGRARILDPDGVRRAVGGMEAMRAAFADVKKHLK
ncbi:MAG: DUF726 domain-containing protein [Lentisphaeria bacterium]|nr:DUF726 domain-containing protein [Lentisphaeria bacterium]